MRLEDMLLALEDGPVDYGPDDDRVLVPVATANKIATALRAGQAMSDAHMEEESGNVYGYACAADDWDTATKG